MSGTHAALSPSARHRWGACPGSVREEAKHPEPPDGAAAIDGTRTHALLERAITYPGFIIEQSVGQSVTDEYGTYTIDQARVDRVLVALNYIKERAKAAGVTPIAEKRVFPDGLVGRADMSGTVDCQIPGTDVYEIIDYKDGMGIVSAENNPQLEMYALGVLAGLEKKPKTIQFTIIQPKLTVKGMPPISTWNISTKGLLAKVPDIIAQAAACDAPDAPLVPGDAQCKFCRAKGACPALASKAMNEVGMMFNPIQPPIPVVDPTKSPEDIAQQAAGKDPGMMSVDELVRIYQGAPLMRQLLEAVEAKLQERLEAGEVIPGVKLVRGNGKRAWALPEGEIAEKLKGMGVPKAAMYVTKLVSPAQAEKLTWKKGDEMVKLGDRQLARLSEEYIVQQPGKPTLAHEADSRPAINLNAAPMFGAIDVKAEDVTTVMTIRGDGTVDVPPPLPAFLQAIAPTFTNESAGTTTIVEPAAPAPVALPSWLTGG